MYGVHRTQSKNVQKELETIMKTIRREETQNEIKKSVQIYPSFQEKETDLHSYNKREAWKKKKRERSLSSG